MLENKLKSMQCIVDTQQINIKGENILSLDIPEHICIDQRKISYKHDNSISLVLNLHKRYGTYKAITLKNEYISEFVQVMQDINVLNLEDIDFNRVDIALDSNLEFNEDFKLISFIYELFTTGSRKNSRWSTISLDTLEPNTLNNKSTSFEIEFYDKELESKGSHTHKARMEFKFIGRNYNDFDIYLDNLFNKVKLVEKINIVEKTISERLLRIWNKNKDKKGMNFSKFVSEYDKYFFTRNVLKQVYELSGMTGDFDNWLKAFKKHNNIEFCTKKDVLMVEKYLKKAIRTYKN